MMHGQYLRSWESLSMEEQLKFYKAFLDKPTRQKGRTNDYKDIHTTMNKENIGLIDSEYQKLQESETFREIMTKLNIDTHAFL